MRAVQITDPIVPALITATATLAVALLGAVVAFVAAYLSPSVASLRTRRQQVDFYFDTAASALLVVQGARHMAQSIDRRYHRGTDEEYRRFNVQLAEREIERYVDAMAAARASLAAVRPYCPEVRSGSRAAGNSLRRTNRECAAS